MPKIGILGSLVWDVIHGRDPAAAAGRGVGWDRLRAGRIRGRPAPGVADRAADQGRERSPRRSRRVAARSDPPGSGRPVRRGAGPQQPRHSPLPVSGTALRADVRRRPRLDMGGTWPDGPRPRRIVYQLHLRIRARTRHGAGPAPGFSPSAVCRSPQPAASGCPRMGCEYFVLSATRPRGSAASTWYR